jgi:hypothetical protein
MTEGGKLSLFLENLAEHGLQYRSGMLQSWNKLCFTSGDIDVSMALPGPNAETKGYVSRSWFCVCFLRWGFVLMGVMCVCVRFSGLARVRWVTLGDLVMEGRRMACGLTRGFPSAPRDETWVVEHALTTDF